MSLRHDYSRALFAEIKSEFFYFIFFSKTDHALRRKTSTRKEFLLRNVAFNES